MREIVKNILELSFKAIFNKKYRSKSERWLIFKTLIKLYFLSRKSTKSTFTDVNFFQFKVKGFNPQSLLFLFEEIFLTKDYFFETNSSQPIIIDCGANIGISILFFKKIYPNSIIYAFEPDPKTFELLVFNIEQNNLANVHTYNFALAKDEGKIKIFNSSSIFSSLTTSVFQERGGDDFVEIDSIVFSGFLKDKYVDLIKIDVEGAEIEILDDLFKNDLLKNSKNYIVEFHLNLNSSEFLLPAFLNYFLENGFKYNLKSFFYKPRSFQDLLIYFYLSK